MVIPDANLLVYAYNDNDFARFSGLKWRNPVAKARIWPTARPRSSVNLVPPAHAMDQRLG